MGILSESNGQNGSGLKEWLTHLLTVGRVSSSHETLKSSSIGAQTPQKPRWLRTPSVQVHAWTLLCLTASKKEARGGSSHTSYTGTPLETDLDTGIGDPYNLRSRSLCQSGFLGKKKIKAPDLMHAATLGAERTRTLHGVIPKGDSVLAGPGPSHRPYPKPPSDERRAWPPAPFSHHSTLAITLCPSPARQSTSHPRNNHALVQSLLTMTIHVQAGLQLKNERQRG
jgi:hypothetical protein